MAEGDRHTTPRRVISVGDGPWAKFGEIVGERNRSDVIRQFIDWYVREPGAKFPDRPAQRMGCRGDIRSRRRRANDGKDT